MYLGAHWEPVRRSSPGVVGAELRVRQGLGEVPSGLGWWARVGDVACRLRTRRRRARSEADAHAASACASPLRSLRAVPVRPVKRPWLDGLAIGGLVASKQRSGHVLHMGARNQRAKVAAGASPAG